MEKQKDFDHMLKQAGKFDKLSIYSDYLKDQSKKHDPNFIHTYREAITCFREYLKFDSQPPLQLCNHLTQVFSFTFLSIRNFSGGEHFGEVYNSFNDLRSYIADTDTKAIIYSDLSYLFWLQNDRDKALDYGKQCLVLVEKTGNCDILPGRYTNLGFIYESMGDMLKADDCYKKSLSFGMKVNSNRIISLAYCGFGRVNMAENDFKSAINYFKEALKYLQDESSDSYMTVCSNLGVAYGQLGEFQESLNYYCKFINPKIKYENPEIYFSSLMNAANCYQSLGEYEKAEKNLLEVTDGIDIHHNVQAVSGATISLGKINLAQGRIETALTYYQKYKDQVSQNGNKIQEVLADVGIGEAYQRLRDYDQAFLVMGRALNNAKALNLKSELLHIYKLLSQFCEETNQCADALKYYKEYQNHEMEIRETKHELEIKSIKSRFEKTSIRVENDILHKTHSMIPIELVNLVKTPIIGKSSVMQNIIKKALLYAEDTSAPVLITGESGTGKDIIARIIHYAGLRKNFPYTSVNSVAFADSLVESAFFGSEKGSYTGSTSQKEGYFEAAQNGTLFLDEIGEMPLPMQSKFLRVLEEHIIHRIGGTQDIKVDFRLISATNKDLYELTEQNLFRFDLLNRINTLEINIPPLRERKEDIPLLIEYFISLFKSQSGSGLVVFSKEAIEYLTTYQFPGNVRELKNIIKRSILLSTKKVIEPEDIVLHVSNSMQKFNQNEPLTTLNLEEWERYLIEKAMLQSGNIQAKAAKLLGISAFSLNRKLKKLS